MDRFNITRCTHDGGKGIIGSNQQLFDKACKHKNKSKPNVKNLVKQMNNEKKKIIKEYGEEDVNSIFMFRTFQKRWKQKHNIKSEGKQSRNESNEENKNRQPENYDADETISLDKLREQSSLSSEQSRSIQIGEDFRHETSDLSESCISNESANSKIQERMNELQSLSVMPINNVESNQDRRRKAVLFKQQFQNQFKQNLNKRYKECLEQMHEKWQEKRKYQQMNDDEFKKITEQKIKTWDDISLDKLKAHIWYNHPTQKGHIPYRIMQSIGKLLDFSENREIPQFNMSLGLGSSLHLLTIKMFAKFFIFLTFINIPAMLIFMDGQYSANSRASIIQQKFLSFTIGNLGEQGVYCSKINLASSISLELSCPSGKLDKIADFGLSNKNRQHCGRIHNHENEKFEFADKCSSSQTKSLRSSQFAEELKSKFDQDCFGQRSCQVDIQINQLDESCYNEIKERLKFSQFYKSENKSLTNIFNSALTFNDYKILEPDFIVLHSCLIEEYKIFGNAISRSNVQICLICLDIITMISLAVFAEIIIFMQNDYITFYNDKRVDMTDFTVKITSLPKSFKIFNSQIEMKYKIWQFITQKINDAKKLENQNDIDETIVEIAFGLKSFKVINDYMHLENKNQELETLLIQQNKNKLVNIQKKINNKKAKLRKHLEKIKKQQIDPFNIDSVQKFYEDIVVVYVTFKSSVTKNFVEQKVFKKISIFQNLQKNIEMEVQARQEFQKSKTIRKIQSYQEIKSEVNQIQNQISRAKNFKRSSTQILSSSHQVPIQISQVQIEQNQTDQQDDLLNKTLQPKLKSKLLINKFKTQIRDKVKEQEILIDGQFELETAIDEPEFIMWSNISYSKQSRLLRKVLSIIILILIISFQISQMIRMEKQKQNINDKLDLSSCEMNITKKMAFEDSQRGQDSIGFMNCFCYQSWQLDSQFHSMTFEEYGSDQKFCQEWFEDYFTNQLYGLTFSMIVCFINFFGQQILILAVQNEKNFSTAAESKSTFLLIFFQQFICIAIIQIANDQFITEHEFNSNWYATSGTQICITMLMFTFSSKGGDIFEIAFNYFKRLKDRSFQWSMNFEEKQQFQTKMIKQKDVNAIYTGEQINIGDKLASIYCVLFICLTFSAGIPILYPIGLVFFFVTYWFDKISITRFYQVSKNFNGELPILSTKFIHLSLVLHLILSCFMFSSRSIFIFGEFKGTHFDVDMEEKSIWEFNHFVILLSFGLFLIILELHFRTNYNIVYKILNRIKKVQNCGQVHCNNFYEEIDIDQLRDFYEKKIEENQKMRKMYYSIKKSKKGDGLFDSHPNIDIETFKKYLTSFKKNIQIIQVQIKQIIEEVSDDQEEEDCDVCDHHHYSSSESSSENDIDQKFEKEHECLQKKLEILDKRNLHKDYKENPKFKLRCASIIQSYDIFDNPSYFGIHKAKQRAQILSDEQFMNNN